MSIEALNWAWQQVGIKPTEKLTLLAIADHADELGRNAFPSRSRLAKKTGLAEATITRAIKSLAGKGKIHVERVKSKAGDFDHNEYTLPIENVTVSRGVGSQQDNGGWAQGVTRVGSQCAPNHPYNHPKEEEKKSTPSFEIVKIKDSEYKWPSPEALVALYNAEAADELPAVVKLTPERRKKANKYLKVFPELSFWQEVFKETHLSTFLRGLKSNKDHEGFKGDFDWLLTRGKDQTENAIKAFEGKYRDATR